MGAFSSLRSAVSSCSASVSALTTLAATVTSLSHNVASTSGRVADVCDEVTQTTPQIREAVSSFTGLCESLNSILSKFSFLLNPLFSAYDNVASVWSALCKAIVYVFNTAYNKLELVYQVLFDEAGLISEHVLPVICAVACLVLLFVYCSPTLNAACTSLWSTAILGCAGLLKGLFPDSFLSEWVMGLSKIPIAEAQVVVDGPLFTPFVSSATIGSTLAFILSTVVCFFFSREGVKMRDDRNPLMGALKFAGDFTAKCNHLFTFYRNVRENFGNLLGWIIDAAADAVGMESPTLVSLNKLLQKDDLFHWLEDVDNATKAEGRLQRFADSSFPSVLATLNDRGMVIRAACVVRPVVSFLATRLHSAQAKLEKEIQACSSHKGIGVQRPEPFMVQWYGAPGVGKTRNMEFLIHDLLNLMKEPEMNRLYVVPRADAYWSGYAHQTAVMLDDLGQILDSSGQCPDVKLIIDLKSSHCVGLPMADIESKGTCFTSRYIFATSNVKNPPPGSGLVTMEAFARRRNVLVEVVALGEMDIEHPVDHLRFHIRDSLNRNEILEGLSDLTYTQLLSFIFVRAQQHFTKGRTLSQALGRTADLEHIGRTCSLQALDSDDESCYKDAQAGGTTSDMVFRSLQYAYLGSLSPTDFFPSAAINAKYDCLSADQKDLFNIWKTQILFKPIAEETLGFWIDALHEDWRNTCLLRLPLLKFNNVKFISLFGRPDSMFRDAFEGDEDVLEELMIMPQRTQFAYCLLARHHQSLTNALVEPKVGSQSNILFFLKKILSGFYKLPNWVKIILKVGIIFCAMSLASSALSAILSIPRALAGCLVSAGSEILSQGPVAYSNSDDVPATKTRKSRYGFLMAQSADLEKTWSAWADRDPFLKQSIGKNLVIIKMGPSAYFRGIMVNTDWLMTVDHAFSMCESGYPFEIICSRARHHLLLDKRPEFYIKLKDQDVAFLRVDGVDGAKNNLLPHFVSRHQLSVYVGSNACVVRPDLHLSTGEVDSFLDVKIFGVKMQTGEPKRLVYSSDKVSLVSVRTLDYEFEGANGDCGSPLCVPSAINSQPLIAGIHVAGYKKNYAAMGYVGSNAAVVFREDIEALLPACIVKVANGPSVFGQLEKNRDPFEPKQVFFLGRVPANLAADVPRDTVLRPSEIFHKMEQFRKHTTEPSILTTHDERVPKGVNFSPYLSGVEKFNETANSFDMVIAREAYLNMKNRVLSVLKGIPVPGGQPRLRTEHEVINGIPGETYFDPLDVSTSAGWPFNKEGKGKNKRVHLSGETGDYLIDRTSTVYAAFVQLQESIVSGEVMELVTSECAKDERLPLAKIYEKPKTRLFTILPFHYNLLVRKYFLDFSASLMRAHNKLPCKVGIDPLGGEWTRLSSQFLEVSDEGFSADYSSFDGRAPVFAFQWFCEMADEYYGDEHGSENSCARRALIMMASNHLTLCGDKCFQVQGGMPSGFSLTVIFNSLLNEFYMRYAFGWALKKDHVIRSRSVGQTALDFDRIFLAVYGDDNLVAVPFDLKWYTLPLVAQILLQVNVVIKSGLDKSADVFATVTQPLHELSFLSRGFKLHDSGFYQAPLKWDSVVERLYWIRKGKALTAAEALSENIVSALDEAVAHGSIAYKALRLQLIGAMADLHLPFPSVNDYEVALMNWLEKVSGSEMVCSPTLVGMEVLEDVPQVHQQAWDLQTVEIFPNICCVSTRSFSKANYPASCIIVNCSASKKVQGIRGPVDWRDLENRIWAYTMVMIEDKQILNTSMGINSDGLVFVSSFGGGMGVVCACLAALATGKYSPHAVLHRFRLLTGVADITKYAGGAGAYLLLACGAGKKYSAQSCAVGAITRGSNSLDRLIDLGPCAILSGVFTPFVTSRNVQCWATFATGYGGICTSREFIDNDVGSGKLAAAITTARVAHESKLFLFFCDFGEVQAAWVLNGMILAGHQAHIGNVSLLKALFKDMQQENFLTMPSSLMVLSKSGGHISAVPGTKQTACFTTDEYKLMGALPGEWRDTIKEQDSVFHTTLQISALKLVLCTRIDHISLSELAQRVLLYYGPLDRISTLLVFFHLVQWSRRPFSVAAVVDCIGAAAWSLFFPKFKQSTSGVCLFPGLPAGNVQEVLHFELSEATVGNQWCVSPNCHFISFLKSAMFFPQCCSSVFNNNCASLFPVHDAYIHALQLCFPNMLTVV